MKLQQKFVVRSLKYMAYAMGYLAQGDTVRAKDCQDYAKLSADVAIELQKLVNEGRITQERLDRLAPLFGEVQAAIEHDEAVRNSDKPVV